jgi:hypothetical protein
MTSALGYGLGFGPILYSLSSEIMPARVKGVCCSLCLAFRYVELFKQDLGLNHALGLFGNESIRWMFEFIGLYCFPLKHIDVKVKKKPSIDKHYRSREQTPAFLDQIFVKKNDKR